MKPSALRITRLACALAALGASLSAQAQYGHSSCLDDPPYGGFSHADAGTGSPYANGCIRALSDGRAAVLLPSALEGAGRAPGDGPLRRHAWGFLDQNGRLAIPPIFEAASDFRHGLAPVKWQGKWGFIDTRGRMAVRPQFDAVQGYAEIGLAVATQDGRQRLIDRQGNAVGEPFDPGVIGLRLQDGVPALATVEYKMEYRSSTGERRFGDTGIQLAKLYGKDLYVAVTDQGKYGLLDKDWNWVLDPVYQDISAPGEDGALATAYGPRGAVLLDAQGKPIGEDGGYQDLSPLGKAFWSTELARGSYAILDAAGAPVAKLNADEAYGSRRYGDTLLYPSGGRLMALAPGLAEPLALGAGLSAAADDQGYVLFTNAESTPAGLLTPKGVWLHGAAAPAWLAEVGRMEVRQGKLWLFKDGGLLNVLDGDGRALLQPDAVQAAQEMALTQLPLDVPGGALGVLSQGHCHCGSDTGAGLVLADGSIAADPSWNAVIPLDGAGDYDDYGRPARSELKAEQLRYAAETADGMRLLDASGKPMDLPAQQHIGAFRHGYALAYTDGASRMIDRDGKTYALPDYFETDIVAPGVVRFLETAAEDAPWGLYDFLAGKEISPPRYRDIGEFQDGQAVASLGPDRAGVIDLQGRWIVPASHHGAERVNAQVWRVQQAGPQSDEYTRPAALFNAQGRALTAFLPGLRAGMDDGAIVAGDGKRRWIVSPDGADALDMEDATYARLGDWMEIRRAPRSGYLDAQGRWQIAPGAAVAGTFRGSPARALLTDDDGARLIDAQGKTVASLPAGEWSWPLDSATLLRRYTAAGKQKTDYAGLDGKVRFTVDGHASGYSEGFAVTQLSSSAMRAIDAKGALTGPAFDALGPLREGLAPVYTDRAYGYADAHGRLAILPAYDTVSPFRDRRAVVSTMDMSMIIDPAGRQVARVAMECGVRALYGSHNQRLWPLTLPRRCRR
jgi:hypothetical protein